MYLPLQSVQLLWGIGIHGWPATACLPMGMDQLVLGSGPHKPEEHHFCIYIQGQP